MPERAGAENRRINEASARAEEARAYLAAVRRAGYRDYCRYRAARRNWERTRPWTPLPRSGP